MRNLCRHNTTLLFLSSLLLGPSGPVLAQDLVIHGGFLFDAVSDDVRPNSGILIRAGKLLAVDADLNSLELGGIPILELSNNHYILPGFFDLHAHHAIDLFGQGRVDEQAAYPSIFLANGVTSVFPAGEMNPYQMRELRLAIERGERVGPRMFNSGPYFGSWRPGWDRNMTTDSIAREVDYWTSLGVQSFKAKGITPLHLQALIRRAHAHGATVTGHLESGFRNTVNPRDAILMGIDRIEHFLGGDAISDDRPAYSSLIEFDPDTPAFDSIAALYIRHGVFFDATLTAYGYYGERDPEVFDYFTDEKAFLTPYMRRIIDARELRAVNEQFETIYWVKRRTIKAFYDAGGAHLITLGTDHPSWGEFFSGFSAHRELHTFVLAGIAPADAIRFATINGARAMNVSSLLGTVEPGKLADLFVAEGNPLEDIRNTRNVVWVIKNGVQYDASLLLDGVRGRIGPAGPEEEPGWKPRRGAERD